MNNNKFIINFYWVCTEVTEVSWCFLSNWVISFMCNRGVGVDWITDLHLNGMSMVVPARQRVSEKNLPPNLLILMLSWISWFNELLWIWYQSGGYVLFVRNQYIVSRDYVKRALWLEVKEPVSWKDCALQTQSKGPFQGYQTTELQPR